MTYVKTETLITTFLFETQAWISILSDLTQELHSFHIAANWYTNTPDTSVLPFKILLS